jgi:cytochrome o ubiquinol oxidase subunit 2
MRVVATVAICCGLGGCAQGVLDPQGPVAFAQRTILFNSVTIMLAIIIPVIVATLIFAYRFRSSNTRAPYWPDWEYSGRLELLVWSVPILVVMFVGGIGYLSSHDLDPAKPLASKEAPLKIQVVSLDWKWLFIYPDQNIASVNHLVLPAGVPVEFTLTSATVMNSFFVPQLGSQIYTMARMATRLNLQADKPGTYPGLSAQYSGAGFSGMRFNAQALTPEQFKDWIEKTKAEGPELDEACYRALAQPSMSVMPFTFRHVMTGLFDAIVTPPHEGHTHTARSAACLPGEKG